ncbi:hypothetical protein MMC13_007579 [Lambiella insularis]|nr:hypothetical protein [Lambiella insularis]
MSGEQTMYAPKHPPGSNLKGGGLRGGPKRWTGGGPRPARHIPWPEIFKHHISVLEGHLKMTDMIRKHTVPDTGNWRTIMAIVERTQEMLRMAKEATRSFVPPPNDREAVPIGSSSASMYPGYSPADHEYGKAAQEFGQQWSAAKAQGIDFQPASDGPQYEFSQAKGAKRATLAKIRATKAARGEGSGSGSGSGSDVAPAASKGPRDSTSDTRAHDPQGVEDRDGANPYFVVDINPTPVSLPSVSTKSVKRTLETQSSDDPVGSKAKKAKSTHDGVLANTSETRVKFEDISGEVDARMKEKEERRKRKEEKKRKRESAGESGGLEAVAETDKPKKPKIQKLDEAVESNGSASKKLQGSGGEEAGKEAEVKIRVRLALSVRRYELPPTVIARALPVAKIPKSTTSAHRDAPRLSLKRKRPSKDVSKDDTPKAFARLMLFHTQGVKPRAGLDDGAAKSKKQKRTADATDQNAFVSTEASVDSIPRIKPGERLSEYSARVDAALPVSRPSKKGTNNVQGLSGANQPRTKMERKMHRMYKEWREVEAKRKEKAEEEKEENEEKSLEFGEIRQSSHRSKSARKRKQKSSDEEDPWAAVRRDREARARGENGTTGGLVGLHDVVQAPPQLLKVPKEKIRVMNGAKADVLDVPGSAGSLRRREELGLARRSVVAGYRQLMEERRRLQGLL